ncbi:MAG: putative inorganic carbon transporter subunit DabA, partial [Bdellovibrio sp.]
RKPNIDTQSMGLSDKEQAQLGFDTSSLALENQVSLAFGALKNMGLTKNFAKFVFFLGHGSESANNPYAGALDCGACAGHNGSGNARFLAGLLNSQEVRSSLRIKGVDIPKETIFLSGWHHTTKDELRLDGLDDLSDSATRDLNKYLPIFEEALKNVRMERAQRLSLQASTDVRQIQKALSQRSQDWSEIRPEWGLARNACLIAARRDLTRGVSLQGRSFLHDYEHQTDPDLSKLELIMTAPMIVTNWINMQYYASTVDPQKFGAGNKVLTNVVGGIGCVQGNGSDLLGGLTEQSVWFKGDYYHEPLRLQVLIEAPTDSLEQIIDRHSMVRDLVVNDWLKIISVDPQTGEFKMFHANAWIPLQESPPDRVWH